MPTSTGLLFVYHFLSFQHRLCYHSLQLLVVPHESCITLNGASIYNVVDTEQCALPELQGRQGQRSKCGPRFRKNKQYSARKSWLHALSLENPNLATSKLQSDSFTNNSWSQFRTFCDFNIRIWIRNPISAETLWTTILSYLGCHITPFAFCNRLRLRAGSAAIGMGEAMGGPSLTAMQSCLDSAPDEGSGDKYRRGVWVGNFGARYFP